MIFRKQTGCNARFSALNCAAVAFAGALFPLVFALPGAAQKLPSGCPPKAQRDGVVDVLHGVRIADPYRWLEAQYSPATRKWIAAEDRCSAGTLDTLPGRKAIAAELGTLMRTRQSSVPFERNQRFFYMQRDANQDLFLIYMRQGLDGKPVVLVDPRPMSADHSTSVSLLGASDDGRYMLYGVRLGGQDQVTLHVMNVRTRQNLSDQFAHRLYFGIGFTRDEKGLYYATTGVRGPRILYHRMGTPSSADRRVFGGTYNRQYIISAHVYGDGHWLLAHVSQGTSGGNAIYVKNLLAKNSPFRLIAHSATNYFTPEIAGNTLYLETDWNAANHRIVAVNLAGNTAPSAWHDVVPQGPDPITGFSLAGGKLLVRYLVNASYRLKIFDPNGKFEGEIPLPAMGSVSGVESRWKSNDVMFSYQSSAIPPRIYHYDMATKRLRVVEEQQSPVVAADFVLRQVWYHSKDGTRVPMFLFYKKGIEPNGRIPTLLTGYGGFDISLTPRFNPEAIVWAEHGGIYAVANMRGGGEFGEAWHRAGMLGKKQNVFNDFYGAAEWLIRNHYTNSEKLGIIGMSNGGLLMGASLTQEPKLFRAVVCMYPLLDMLRYQKFMGGPWWVSEYGSAANAQQFKYLLKYSPYQNIHRGTQYPAVLFITGDGDTRVAPLHARKMTARLQADAENGPGKPILLLYDTKSGHSGGRPVGQQIAEMTNILSFLFWQLGVRAGH
jgi:prolyl oligopeptidase